MKRALAALAALCVLAATASASTYKVSNTRYIRTEWARTGLVNWNLASGVSGAQVEQFDWVIHVGFNGKANQATNYSLCRTDSLTTSGSVAVPKLPLVPQLFLIPAIVIDDSPSAFTASATCSLGVAHIAPTGDGTVGGSHEGERTVYPVGSSLGWCDILFGGGAVLSSATRGGVRSLLAYGDNPHFARYELNGTIASDMDSVARSATGDTSMDWVKLNNYTGLTFTPAQSIFALTGGSANNDSTTAVALTRFGTNWPALLYAMAYLDSLTGHKVFGPTGKGLVVYDRAQWGGSGIPAGTLTENEQLRAVTGILDAFGNGAVQRYAIVAFGAGTRSYRTHPGGLWWADSTAFKASMDSLKVHGIPLTVAAAPESLTAQEVKWWNRAGAVRWTPWARIGLDTLALGASGTTSFATVIDPWGRYRNRAYFGDSLSHAVMGSDSSVTQLLKNARANLGTIVGASNLSGLAVAPDDDWTPYQARLTTGARLDSLWYATRQAGFTSLLYNGQVKSWATANPQGWRVTRGTVTDVAGGSLRLVAHNGYGMGGSAYWGQQDSLAATTPTVSYALAVTEDSRFWHGAVNRLASDYAWFPYDKTSDALFGGGRYFSTADDLYGVDRADVALIPMQAFGGTSATLGNVPRPGWWHVKHITDAAKAINTMCGRPLIVFGWPEDVTP